MSMWIIWVEGVGEEESKGVSEKGNGRGSFLFCFGVADVV